MMIQRLMTAALLVAALNAPAMAADAPNTIVMKNFDFTPMAMTVNAGTTVTW